MTNFWQFLELTALLGGVLAAMAFVGLMLNLLFFPEMWQQPDLPRWIRCLTEGR